MEAKKLVIGIDLGSADSYVAYVGKGAIDVVQNEVSQRKTPTLVGFTDRERLLGDQAFSQFKSNVKNSVRNFKHLLGQKMDSPSVETETFWATSNLVADSDGYASCSVSYKGETSVFSATAITAMFLTKLKDITEAWCQGTVADVVIGVPSYFSGYQRTALLDASKIAGLNVLRVMNEHTASALEYGYFRTNDFDVEKPQTVAFCQMGHVVFSVAIVQFVRGKLTVLCERSEKVGGRDMDECLMRTFAATFKKKTGCDVLSNKKALVKLEDAVTKCKKILSANSEASVSCECLMEDEDFGSNVNRADFLETCKPLMQKVNDCLEGAKAGCGLPASAIDSVEICGGASRVPWVKEMCSKAFGGKELSTTMNADECVARGCALQAAILSPLYKVREFKVEDTSPLPISLGWKSVANGNAETQAALGERSAVIFPENTLMNLVKVLTFYRKDSFELKAAYAEEKKQGVPKELGAYSIQVPAAVDFKKIKVKAALTVHGTFELQSAQMVEEDTEETANAENQQPEAVSKKENGSGDLKRQSEDSTNKEPDKKKRKFKRTDLTVTCSGCPGLAADELAKRKGVEVQMIKEYHEIVEVNARRNDLESYILTMRSSIGDGGKYAAFITDADRPTLSSQLEKAEDWLYDHMDDGKQAIIAKLDELRVLGDPVINRCKENDERAGRIASFEKATAALKATAQLPANVEKGKSVEKACDDAMQWLAALVEKQEKLSKHENPVLLCSSIDARHEELSKLADSVLGGRGDTSPGELPGGSPDAKQHEDEPSSQVSGGAGARAGAMEVD